MDIETDVVVAGGGPAGMIAGLMLAAKGVRATVLESHADFSREYRGEVLMPRFVQMTKQIGLFSHIEKFPHLKLNGFEFFAGSRPLMTLRVDELCPEAPFILWMPQPVLLDALRQKAGRFPSFKLVFKAHADRPIFEGDRVAGVEATVDGRKTRIASKLVIGADGRSSSVCAAGGFRFEYAEHDFDVLWFTMPKPAGYGDSVRAFVTARHNCLVLPKLPNHLQCGLILRVGEYARYLRRGIAHLKEDLKATHPLFRDFADGAKDFSEFSLLPAKAERVAEWAREGCLLVGDAAHTCSPAGAIGVSMAAATAIVAADVVADGFRRCDLTKRALDRVQAERIAEVREVQAIQRRAASVVAAFGPLGRAWTVMAFALGARTGLLRRTQRRLMTMDRPLPVAADWKDVLA